MKQISVYKGRTNIVTANLGFDVSTETITSQIREGKNQTSDLIAEWTITHATDGTDGEVVFTLDDSVTAGIEKSVGYMDIKRLSGGEPLNVIDELIEVLFKDTVTA